MIPGTERIWSDAQITLKNTRTNIHAGKQTRPTRKEEWVEDHSTRARSTIWGRTTSQGKPIYNESPSYIIGFQRGRRRKCTNTRSLTYSPNIINQIPAFYLARGANSHAREVSAAAGHIRMTHPGYPHDAAVQKENTSKVYVMATVLGHGSAETVANNL
ncbi:uncharacterized protein EI90DRAFT_3086372 [Cantharellus anzutake]|uniref:uncharacterized protein n=1 Tax=Cantharellus anzutake TaxID=1750568 RepID=UPI0019072863|nr:uncharacterized protein EI90DRAFT_3086372 [Cantharellus anzutake]KAF8316485.1 hypothetical protein EI90DRAFT_3086372 [Cantharellus anzutake]